jgi:hypothetical protein
VIVETRIGVGVGIGIGIDSDWVGPHARCSLVTRISSASRVAPALVPVAEGQEVFRKKRGQPQRTGILIFHWYKWRF